MTLYSRSASALALAAALTMAATPASAADLPVPASGAAPVAHSGWSIADDTADHHRRRGYRHRRGVDASDVIAGVLVLGGIAAIASAASRNDRDRRYRDVRYRDRDYRSSPRASDSSGLDRAVDICLGEIERNVRVDEVRNVARTGAGWQVDGTLYDGQGFSCRIGNDGRVDGIEYGGTGRVSASGYAPVEDRQFSEETYFKAWQDVDAGDRAPQADVRYTEADYEAPQSGVPAYPGGPVDGDLYPGERGQ